VLALGTNFNIAVRGKVDATVSGHHQAHAIRSHRCSTKKVGPVEQWQLLVDFSIFNVQQLVLFK
jgi:hypothetical protein